ncbi:MAG: PD40 domain-containing protein, partial [Pirellulales bacterium]|nr:PD40 domain-containing protein [Pirellulales bacterium]
MTRHAVDRHFRRNSSLHTKRLSFEPLEERQLLSVQPITLTDPSFWGVSAHGDSAMPFGSGGPVKGRMMSADGQRIVFQSDAANLVPGDNNGSTDVFVYDRGTGAVSLVSTNYEGTATAERGGTKPQITPDGRYVVFLSDAIDLVASPVINNFFQGQPRLFRRDLSTGTTELVSINLAGTDGAAVGDFSISDDGRYVAFDASSSSLAPEDTRGVQQAFLRDMVAHTTTLISKTGGIAGNRNSATPVISGDGKYVVFNSDADGLVPNDNNTAPDIMVWNRTSAEISLVTADLNNQFSQNGGARYTGQCVSADGRYVVFESSSNNLVSQNTAWQTNVYLRDTQTATTWLVSANADGTAGTDGRNPAITPNGQFVGFLSNSSNLASDVADTNGKTDVFLATMTGSGASLAISNRMASVNSAGDNGGNGSSGLAMHYYDFSPGTPQVTADGRYVAFESNADNLVAGITDANQGHANGNYRRDVFIRDMQENQTRAASLTPTGDRTGDSGSYTVLLSDDGRYVAFESDADNLAPGDGNRSRDVFTRDMTAGLTDVISRRSPLLPATLLAPEGGRTADATPDGRYMLFTSTSQEIAPDVSNFWRSLEAYVYDRETGVTELVSVMPDGSVAEPGIDNWAKISNDGRFVIFQSQSNDLDPSVTGTNGGLYLHDRVTGQTRLINRNSTTGAPANAYHGNVGLAISPDDRYVAFTSSGTNLVSGVTVLSGQSNLYLFDRQTGTVRMVTQNAAGTASGSGYTNAELFQPAFSADSRKLVFLSQAGDLISGVSDTNGAADVFALDLPTGTLQLVTARADGNASNNTWTAGLGEAAPTISADGRYVAFTSRATDLVPGVTGYRQVYRCDLETGTTELVSKSRVSVHQNHIPAAAVEPGAVRPGRRYGKGPWKAT